MYVMVEVFRCSYWQNALSVLSILMHHLVLELCTFLSQSIVDLLLIFMVDKAILNRQDVVMVLLFKSIGVCDGLDGGVVILKGESNSVSKTPSC